MGKIRALSSCNFVSLVGKILRLNTYVFSTVWNNAWLIDIKDKYFNQFLKEVQKYLCKYKGQEILEKMNAETKVVSSLCFRSVYLLSAGGGESVSRTQQDVS